MRYLKIIFISIIVFTAPFLDTYRAQAISQSIVISQVQLGGAGSGTAGQEYVIIYNNSLSDVDITNWCLTYTSASGASTSSLICIRANDATTRVWLTAKSHAMYVSADYKAASGVGGDGVFTYKSGMASTGGRIRLLDATTTEIDAVVWGNVLGEAAAAEPPAGKVLARSGEYSMQDTDNSAADFMSAIPRTSQSGIYEVILDVCPNILGAQQSIPKGLVYDSGGNCVAPPPVDVCPNIAEFQTQLPAGYLADDSGNCQPDSCTNILGLQISIPEYYEEDGIGNCTEQDVCLNIQLAQHTIPEGYKMDVSGLCVLDLVPLEISEILPNPKGADPNNEFIELYNPSNEVVSIDRYMLSYGLNLDRGFTLIAGDTIQPHEYKVLKNSDFGFTLTNTTGRVVLKGIDDSLIDDTGVYESAGDDMAWARIDGIWQYTDRATPGSANAPIVVEAEDEVSSAIKTVAVCPTGKYRNPLTNRCRSIESDASVLASCESDQYRNPETGRCRKVATTSSLTPCKDGQYRSEETNRCRSISTANAQLAPCKEGQERNVDTNRCRNVTAKSVPAAAYAVESVKDGTKAFVGWWAVGGVGSMALGYAGREWRREISSWIRKIIQFKLSK